jgi:hypothetical protein
MSNGNVPLLVLELANSIKPKRPSGTRNAYLLDPLKSKETLLDFLRQIHHPYIDYDILFSLTIDLDEIKIIREALEQIIIYIVEKKELSTATIIPLNEGAKHCCWVRQLKADGTYSDVLQTGTLVGMIASICILELAKCEFERIKLCCRSQCGLYFYDTTRNRSACWHAENPCGWRTRSERRK